MDHPKIILIDLPTEATDALRKRGFNAVSGSYGAIYKREASRMGGRWDGDSLQLTHSLPNYSEQEIVILQTALVRGVAADPAIVDSWDDVVPGIVNPRPRSMLLHSEETDRIIQHGGVVVAFASAPISARYVAGGTPQEIDNWAFVSLPKWLEISKDEGREIKPIAKSAIGKLLERHLEGASFSCVFNQPSYAELKPEVLAVSKYDGRVALAFKYPKGGLLILLPQVRDFTGLIVDLLETTLPDLVPDKFPDNAGKSAWVERPDYEHPKVIALRDLIANIEAAARADIGAIEADIVQVRSDRGHLHDLLRETGPRLVAAVHKTLTELGFSQVVDVDSTGDGADLMEDLRINDRAPILLVEVKGINGLPADEDALQASKYVAPRMREWGRTDVAALSIINHERLKPGLERENAMPFRQVILQNAARQQFGLMTTWDLFRLARNSTRHGWPHTCVTPLFYEHGRIEPIPVHYELVGTVERFIERLNVVGILLSAQLRKGDRLAFEQPVEFVELTADSLQLDNTAVEEAAAGALVGVATTLTKQQARPGVRVFRVNQAGRGESPRSLSTEE